MGQPEKYVAPPKPPAPTDAMGRPRTKIWPEEMERRKFAIEQASRIVTFHGENMGADSIADKLIDVAGKIEAFIIRDASTSETK